METPRTHRYCAPRFYARRVSQLVVGVILLGFVGLFANRTHAAPPDGNRYQAYELKHKTAAEAETVLAEMLDDLDESVDIVADAKQNRILLNGPEKAHRITAKLLKKFDQPVADDKPAPEPVVKSYPCPKSKFNTVITKLRNRYADVNGVHRR